MSSKQIEEQWLFNPTGRLSQQTVPRACTNNSVDSYNVLYSPTNQLATTLPHRAIQIHLQTIDNKQSATMVKILGLAVVRSGNDIPEPIPCTMATDLSSFGFFQRPVSSSKYEYFHGSAIQTPRMFKCLRSVPPPTAFCKKLLLLRRQFRSKAEWDIQPKQSNFPKILGRLGQQATSPSILFRAWKMTVCLVPKPTRWSRFSLCHLCDDCFYSISSPYNDAPCILQIWENNNDASIRLTLVECQGNDNVPD